MFVDPGQRATAPPASATGDAIVLDGGPRTAGAQAHGSRGRRRSAQITDWNSLSDSMQLMLAGAALRRAADTIAFQAELLAREMEAGGLEDRGGPDALHLLAAIVRVTGTKA